MCFCSLFSLTIKLELRDVSKKLETVNLLFFVHLSAQSATNAQRHKLSSGQLCT